MKTTDKKKIYWNLNWIMVAVVFAVLAIGFLCRYFGAGYPVEANWTEEVLKYLIMWPVLSVIIGVVLWAPFKAFAAKIAKNRGAKEE